MNGVSDSGSEGYDEVAPERSVAEGRVVVERRYHRIRGSRRTDHSPPVIMKLGTSDLGWYFRVYQVTTPNGETYDERLQGKTHEEQCPDQYPYECDCAANGAISWNRSG